MRYPNGIRKNKFVQVNNKSYDNRGMSLEEDINITNEYYRQENKAIIYKKPTPVQIVKVDYPKRSAAVITEAYFRQASTTDYNGIYKGKYVDFEVKETKSQTSFPLANFHEHQIDHMEKILAHDGICFIIIRFSLLNETYFLKAEKLLTHWNDQLKGGRKSIPYKKIKEHGFLIPYKYLIRVDYLAIIDKVYFS